MAGGVLVVSFAAQVPDMWGLEPVSGKTIWPSGVEPTSVYRLDFQGIVENLPKTPVSGFTVDPDTPDVYVVRLGWRLDRIGAADGKVVWSSSFPGWFNPAAPVVSGDHVYASAGMGSVVCIDRSDGSARWETNVSNDCPISMGPYRDTGGCLLASPASVEDLLLVPTGDGRIVALEAGDGSVVKSTDVGVPIAADLGVAHGICVALGVDGAIRALNLESLL